MNESDSKRKVLFICTVGTSILTNIKLKNKSTPLLSIIENLDKSLKPHGNGINRKDRANGCEKIKWTIEELLTDELISEFWKLFDNHEDMVNFSAELSTLINYAPEISSPERQEYRVILIPTSTASSLCCAYLIRKYLLGRGIESETCCIEHLGFPDSTDFAKLGLPEFLSRVFELTKRGLEQGYEVILNPTGGYKSLFPLVTIVGILLKCKVIYKYEQSNTVVEIPPIPLSVDLYKWYREFSKIEVYRGKPYTSVIQNIAEEFRSLVRSKEGLLDTDLLYDFFKNHISQLDRRFNPLYVKATQTSLLDYLGQYKEKIVSLSEIVHLIWKGDRIPEMVDHGMRHHTNLIMIAERLLLPILDNDPNFLSPEELFILLCAIYFHDSGHVIGSIEINGERIILFPDEIRDFHHILGFERLRNYNSSAYFSSSIYDYLMKTWQINDPCIIWEYYLEPPAYIGLYHRRAMPLLSEQKKYDKHIYLFGTPPYEPLENQNFFFIGEKQISTDRILLLCALFRIIDSLDVQVSRTGDELEIRFHQEQLKNEIEEEKIKADKYIKLIDNQIKKVANELRELFFNRVPKSQELRDKLTEIEQNYQLLSLASEEYIRSKLRIHFKEKQKAHFEKHKIIEQVIIEFLGIQNGAYRFNIDLKFKTGLSPQKVQQSRNETLQELKEEYCSPENSAVKQILSKNHIEITYGVNYE